MAVTDRVGRRYLADLLGVDVRSLKNFVDEGMPKLDRGQYSLSACVPWYIQREREAARGSKGLNDLDLARQRKTVAEARKAELDVAKAEEQVIPTEMHAERLRERLQTVAGAVKAISRYHADVKAATTDAAADALLDRIGDELLAELFTLSDSID
jgi:phage terminase Nu1 subunit (DNA packaging protein)